MQLLLLHVLQLERRSVLGASHDGVVEAEGDEGVSRPTGKGGMESLQEEVLSSY